MWVVLLSGLFSVKVSAKFTGVRFYLSCLKLSTIYRLRGVVLALLWSEVPPLFLVLILHFTVTRSFTADEICGDFRVGK